MGNGEIIIRNKQKSEEVIFTGDFTSSKMKHYYCPKCNEELLITENAKSMDLSGYCVRCKTMWVHIEREE